MSFIPLIIVCFGVLVFSFYWYVGDRFRAGWWFCFSLLTALSLLLRFVESLEGWHWWAFAVVAAYIVGGVTDKVGKLVDKRGDLSDFEIPGYHFYYRKIITKPLPPNFVAFQCCFIGNGTSFSSALSPESPSLVVNCLQLGDGYEGVHELPSDYTNGEFKASLAEFVAKAENSAAAGLS